jgi:hypothetical protein
MKEYLDRKLNKYDLVLCNPYYWRFSSVTYGIVINDKTLYLNAGIIKAGSSHVYKINPNQEEEGIRQSLIQQYNHYLQYGQNLVPEIGGLYTCDTLKAYYLYLGEYCLHIRIVHSDIMMPYGDMDFDRHKLYIRFDMTKSATDRSFVENVICKSITALTMQDLMHNWFDYIIYTDADGKHRMADLCFDTKICTKQGQINLLDVNNEMSFTFQNWQYTLDYIFSQK